LKKPELELLKAEYDVIMAQFTKFDAEVKAEGAPAKSGGDGGAPVREEEQVPPSVVFDRVADLVLAMATVESLSPETPEQVAAAQCLRNVLARVDRSSPAAAAASTAAVLARYAECSDAPADELGGVSALELAEHIAQLATAPSARPASPPPLQEEIEPPAQHAPARSPNGAVGEKKQKRERKPRKEKQHKAAAAAVEADAAADAPAAATATAATTVVTTEQFARVNATLAAAPHPTHATNGTVASAAPTAAPAAAMKKRGNERAAAAKPAVSVIEFMGPSVIESEANEEDAESIAAAGV
jgi:hypothetical protein